MFKQTSYSENRTQVNASSYQKNPKGIIHSQFRIVTSGNQRKVYIYTRGEAHWASNELMMSYFLSWEVGSLVFFIFHLQISDICIFCVNCMQVESTGHKPSLSRNPWGQKCFKVQNFSKCRKAILFRKVHTISVIHLGCLRQQV